MDKTVEPTTGNELLERLQKSQFLLERAEEMAAIGSWEFDYLDGTVTASQGAHRIYGVREGEFRVDEIEMIALPEYRPDMDRARDALVHDGIPYDIEFKIARKNDGAVRDIHSKARWDPSTKRLFGIIRDVTEERAIAAKLQELNRDLESKVVERTEELSESNLELSAVLQGLKKAQNELVLSGKFTVLGQLVAGIAHELNTPLGAISSANRAVQKCLGNLTETSEWMAGLDKGQRELYAAIIATAMKSPPLPDARSQWTRRKIIQDLLDSRGVREGVRMAELLVELDLDHLAEELPALFDEPLCLPLLTKAGEQISARRMAEVIAVATDKAVVVVSALRHAVGGQNVSAFGDVDVERDLETVLTLLHNSMKLGVSLDRHYTGARARGSSHDLYQVWMNLINNAVQAMQYEGSLRIDTEMDSEWTTVRITDSGPGIPEELQNRIFEPFFTTKKLGEGMGLGLDICKKIIGSHGGKISFESVPGRTSFTVLLPAAGRKVRL